jgi:hypothetical protein
VQTLSLHTNNWFIGENSRSLGYRFNAIQVQDKPRTTRDWNEGA